MSEDKAIERVVEAVLSASACCEHDESDRQRLRAALKELLAAHDAERDKPPVCTCLTDPGFSCLACDGPLVHGGDLG